MTGGAAHAAADASVPVPDPVNESPPADRFCDLILNGGVASGVVYPWALVELARHYRFRSIGGNSVGAIAAALAAAAEYGRCHGHATAFEPLRRSPLELADEQGGRARMLRLFQPGAGVRRPFEAFVLVVQALYSGRRSAASAIGAVLWRYGLWRWIVGSLGLWLVAAVGLCPWAHLAVPPSPFGIGLAGESAGAAIDGWQAGAWLGLALLGLLGCAAVVVGVAGLKLLADVRAIAAHDFGLCSGRAQTATGGTPAADEEALIEWLHRGVQLSAGRQRADAALTFADLWRAPRHGAMLAPEERSIDLQMFSSNVTLGRPVRWPLCDPNTRLFFRPGEWQRLFPPWLLEQVVAASKPYAPASVSDPALHLAPTDAQAQLMRELREVPGADLPIVVAARMSLCFPLLFTAVPVYAIDYEDERARRELRRCWMSDGGLCTNFPIHLFEAAHPQWPTFGVMLSNRIAPYRKQAVWLPEGHLAGRADNWTRDVPDAQPGGPPRHGLRGLLGLLSGMFVTIKDWNDNLTSRLPHVRNRVLRMNLLKGEGQLNIAMPGRRILHMAHAYGTTGGQLLVQRYLPRRGTCTRAWEEHLYVRALTELRVLHRHLEGYGAAVEAGGHSRALADIVARATVERPLSAEAGRAHADASGSRLTARQAQAIVEAVAAVKALEQSLAQVERQLGPYQPVPQPELRVRAAI